MTQPVAELIEQPPTVVELTTGTLSVIEVVSHRAELDVVHGPTSVVEVLHQPPATVEVLSEPTPTLELLFPGPRGPQGPPGPPGSAGTLENQSYTHEQITPSFLWTVIHNLGFIPVGLLVVDAEGRQHDPQIVTSTRQATVLSFQEPVSGAATVS